jgi:hypothetical protein
MKPSFVTHVLLAALCASCHKANENKLLNQNDGQSVRTAVTETTLEAFPGAEGFGKYATGGRGGRVVEVTNLNDNGPGSFRQAFLEYPGEPITIVFRVGGIINLTSKIKVNRGNITIAGQTAPGDGICLKGASFIINGAKSGGNYGNIIVRHIRSRPGAKDSTGVYGFDMENCHNVIIDHCSFSWANEECAALYDTKNTTVQWCIVSEGLYNAGHMKGNRSYGGVWGGQYATYHHNLVAHQWSRAIRFNGSRAHDTAAVVDYRYNVIYNWGKVNACAGGAIEIPGGTSWINMVNNYYKPGPATAGLRLWFCQADYNTANIGYGLWYMDGNVMEGSTSLTGNNTTGLDVANIPAAYKTAVISGTEFTVAPTTIQTANAAYTSVLAGAGATKPVRDAVDARVVNETSTKTASGSGTFGKPGIIDDPSVVGGWPTYASGTAPTDTDHDGMPDAWEDANGLNKDDAADRNTIHTSGYTMLEVYLNSLL